MSHAALDIVGALGIQQLPEGGLEIAVSHGLEELFKFAKAAVVHIVHHAEHNGVLSHIACV